MQLSTAAAWLDKEKNQNQDPKPQHSRSPPPLCCEANICLCLHREWVQSDFISRSKIAVVYRLHLRSAAMETRHPEHARQDVSSIRLRSSGTWTLLRLRWVRKTNSSKRSKKKKKVTNIVSGLHAASCFLFPGALMISNVTDQERTERQTRLTVGRSCKSDIRVKSVLKKPSDDHFTKVLMNQNKAPSPRVRLKILPQRISKSDMNGWVMQLRSETSCTEHASSSLLSGCQRNRATTRPRRVNRFHRSTPPLASTRRACWSP